MDNKNISSEELLQLKKLAELFGLNVSLVIQAGGETAKVVVSSK